MRMNVDLCLSVGVVAAALGLVACAGGHSGDLVAERTGDLSNPPAARSRADEAMVALCGEGVVTARGAKTLVRAPYLQAVASESATVVWTTTAPGSYFVRVTGADGKEVATVAAVADPSVVPLEVVQLVAPLTGLRPATVYCYEVRAGDAAGAAVEGPAGFRTAPAAKSDAPVHFAVIGDTGAAGPDQTAVMQQVESVPFDLMLQTGDIAYPSGGRHELTRDLFDTYRTLLRSFPLFPASGNHDYDTDDAEPFREAFILPENGGEIGRERWYSFDWGDVHFVALDTERIGAGQADWLDADLSANSLPWTVVYAHRPPFSSGYHGSDVAFRRDFGPVLEAHHVPLVLTGHDHDYERTTPQNGVTYVVTGGGGAPTREVAGASWTAFGESVLHFVYVDVEKDALIVHAIDGSGQEFDSARIARP